MAKKIKIKLSSCEELRVFKKDKNKESAMQKQGISLLRFSDEQVVKDMDNVLRAIGDYIHNHKKTHP